jgi:hypothetical protein
MVNLGQLISVYPSAEIHVAFCQVNPGSSSHARFDMRLQLPHDQIYIPIDQLDVRVKNI